MSRARIIRTASCRRRLPPIRQAADDMPPYQRLLGDAMRGAAELFTREDSVEAQWQVVDGILGGVTPFYPYEPGTWGPDEAYQLIGKHGPWLNPRLSGS